MTAVEQMIERGEKVGFGALTDGFGRVELEIGSGKGTFCIERAKSNSDTMLVGVEIRKKFAKIMADRIRRHSLRNCIVINDDIKNAYRNIFRGECLFDRVFIHFPDPWWKRRHEKRHYLTGDFLDRIAGSLKDHGELFVQTDVFGRARYIHRLLTDSVRLENLDDVGGFVDSSPYGQKSAREKTCEDLGLSMFRIHFRKK